MKKFFEFTDRISDKVFGFTDRIADKLFKSPKINSMFKKIVSREMFDYLLFGVLTTVVNFISFHLCEKLFGTKLALVSNIIAWIVSVLFAFVTNKFIVFRSTGTDSKTLTKEFVSFTGARLLSLGIEELGLIIAQFVFNADKKVFHILSLDISGTMTAKIFLAVIVVILNYIFSKLFIFKNKDKES